MHALHRCFLGSRQLASAAIIVDAKDDVAVAFYKKCGFLELPQVVNRLLLPRGTIAKLFG